MGRHVYSYSYVNGNCNPYPFAFADSNGNTESDTIRDTNPICDARSDDAAITNTAGNTGICFCICAGSLARNAD